MKMYVRQYDKICEYDTMDDVRYRDLTVGMRIFGQSDKLDYLIDYIIIVKRYRIGELPEVVKLIPALGVFQSRERDEAIDKAFEKGWHVYGALSTNKGMVYATEMNKERKWELI